ncbi:DHA2 family efflux MFS transporter permease subunit [Sphingomonas sp. G-3-2-10]|uniref:DHA2 family efflux MFS transporter permease subunit n=1 Tax=Sphingomonas sp. G-3-2-10 TaxID=2728838 RepID=UPI00146E9B3C|nr:DHA2 family efflux MFS transporter permease subunit [Sphingomonas sp. G-3-2-10]NML04666.1 DHA2 family efflux MFS transporter permease subunit [Sphingomonas sp. G-3-2-10]
MASAAANPSAVPAAPAAGVAALPVNRRGLLTLGVMLATIMQILDTTIANVALPHMTPQLGATNDTITWVLTSYIVASAIAMPATGWLSDRIGSRNLFLLAVVGFVIASAMCGAAQNLEEMVAFRILQGVSAAFMNPLSQTVLLDINPPERQGKAMAIWGMGIMVGPILGPVIGGWLTENFDWRWVFFVNLPLGVICIALLWFLLPSRPIRKRTFDIFGFTLLSIGLAAMQLMLDRGQGEDWFGSTEIWIEALVMGIALWMFTIHMFTAKQPMFERSLWKNRNLMTAVGFMAVMGVVMMATMALLPPMLQSLYGYSVLDTGLLLMPRGIGVVLTMAVVAQMLQRGVDPRWLVAIGFAIAGLSLWQMTQWTLMMGSSHFIISGFVQGVGMGLVFTPLQGMAFATLAPHQRTEGSSLMNLSRSIGASVGISVVTTVLARSIQTSHADLAPHVSSEALSTFDPGLLNMLGGSGQAVLAMANAEVNRQAAMIAYLNDFWLMAIITVAAIPLVVLLQRPKGRIESDPSAAGH